MHADSNPPCLLVLEDGTVFRGTLFGAPGTQCGEVVFNTAMSGYQEVLTDPSYCGQIVTMTYPQMGNYGINDEDVESARPQVAGMVIKELAGRFSNHRATKSLDQYLREHAIVGIEGIDTRALTKKLRVDGAMRGIITSEIADPSECLRLARQSPSQVGLDLVQKVAPAETSDWPVRSLLGSTATASPAARPCHPPAQEVAPSETSDWPAHSVSSRHAERSEASPGLMRPEAMEILRSAQNDRLHNQSDIPRNVVAIDCGMKRNILRLLTASGCNVTIVPPTWPAERILESKPNGVFVSNGPGDPAAVHYVIDALKGLIGQVPIFGICLGHQLLALALGASSFKLKFGHRGANQPVKNTTTGRVEITSQNHGFAIDTASLERAGGVPTHVNLNDHTLEGFVHKELPILAVQYHPEAAPGPHDATYLFDCFTTMMCTTRPPTAEDMDAAQRSVSPTRRTLQAHRAPS